MKNKHKVIGALRSANAALLAKRGELRSKLDKGETVDAAFNTEMLKLTENVDELRSQLLEIEDQELTDSILAGHANEAAQDDKRGRASGEYRKAFSQYLRSESVADLPQELRSKLSEQRALNTGANADGGYVVDTETLKTVYEEKITWGALYALVNKVRTERGNQITWPTSEEGLTRGVIIGENQNHGKSETGFGQEVMGAHKISSRIILVSDELLQDAFFDVASYITRIAVKRVDLGIDYYMLHGDGQANNPKGLLLQLKDSKKVSATGTTPAQIMDNVIDVIHAVDPAYRAMPNFRVAVNDKTLATIRKWKDNNGNPIYIRDPRADWPDTLFGEKLVIDNEIPDIGSNGWVFAGDWSAVTVRLAGDMAVRRLNELYAETGQVGFLAWARFGVVLEDKAAMAAGFVTGAGTPDKFLTKEPADLSGQGDNVVVTNAPRDTSAKGSDASGTATDTPEEGGDGAGTNGFGA